MRKCPNCGAMNADDNLFCDECGVKLDALIPAEPAAGSGKKVCPKGHRVDDLGIDFCPECGSTLVDAESVPAATVKEAPKAAGKGKCSRCGYELDDPELLFCPECGNRLGGAPEAGPAAGGPVVDELKPAPHKPELRTVRSADAGPAPELRMPAWMRRATDEDMTVKN